MFDSVSGCLNAVSNKFQASFNRVSKKFQGCLWVSEGVSAVIIVTFMYVSRKCQDRLKKDSRQNKN